MSKRESLPPIYLYDNLPEVLFGYLGFVFWVLAALAFPAQATLVEWPIFESIADSAILKWIDGIVVNPNLLFWIAAVACAAFAVSYRWNLSKSKFLIAFGLSGTFIGIPAALELFDIIHPFAWLGAQLGAMAPAANAGAYFFVGGVCWGIWAASLIWSRVHMRAKLDESGLSITRADGTTDRYELIGLKTSTRNFDYTEYVCGGLGSLVLSLRSGNKNIFQLKRVFNLYWTPLFFWRRSKIDRINEMLSYQGKTTTVDVERLDAEAGADDDGDEDLFDDDPDHDDDGGDDGEFDNTQPLNRSSDSPIS
jgi:hypothetical protein